MEHVRAARLLEKIGQQRQKCLQEAHPSNMASFSLPRAVMNRDNDATQPHRTITSGSQQPLPSSSYSLLNYQLDDFNQSSYLQPRNPHHVRGVPVQNHDTAQQTSYDPSSARYHPYAMPARITYAHPAAHMPGAATTNRPQAYPENSPVMGHDTGDKDCAVNVPHVAYAGTNERGTGTGDRYPKGILRSQVDASLPEIEIQDSEEEHRYSIGPYSMM